jgi:hypothetical protein
VKQKVDRSEMLKLLQHLASRDWFSRSPPEFIQDRVTQERQHCYKDQTFNALLRVHKEWSSLDRVAPSHFDT